MIGKLAVRLAVVVAVSCTIGLGSNLTTYSAEGNLGVYIAGFGVERTSDGVYAAWICDDTVPDRVKLLAGWQRCPGEELPIIRNASKPPVFADWRPLSIDHMIWLAMYVDPGRDWSWCLAYWSDIMIVQCDDGYRVEVTE